MTMTYWRKYRGINEDLPKSEAHKADDIIRTENGIQTVLFIREVTGDKAKVLNTRTMVEEIIDLV